MKIFCIKRTLLQVFILTSLVMPGSILADAPLRRPHQYMVCSNDARHCAVADPKAGVSVYEVGTEMRDPLWHLDKWPQWSFLANGGNYFVVPYYGYNLLSLNYTKSTIMLRVWRDGNFKYSLELKDLIKDFGKLERSVSHFFWGYYKGFDENGDFIIDTVEGRGLSIDIKTGKITEKYLIDIKTGKIIEK
ncbi:MAG: hypothetical protein OEZ51_02005 [Nitrospinota bacterium]|nr:hypothetical protein [Nitrospinota bacterium]